jgi:hypothetical protein
MAIKIRPDENDATFLKEGKLFLSHKCPEGGPEFIEVIRLTPYPRAWIKRVDELSNFQTHHPIIDLSLIDFFFEDYDDIKAGHELEPLLELIDIFGVPGNLIEKVVVGQRGEVTIREESASHKAWRRAFKIVPAPVRSLVSSFSPIVQWEMLTACMRLPALVEIRDNPGLLLLHATLPRNRTCCPSKPFKTLSALLEKCRKHQISFYGLAATEQMVRILKKLSWLKVDPEVYLSFCAVLKKNDPDLLKLLSHAPEIDETLLCLLSNPTLVEAVDCGFVREVISLEEPLQHRSIAQLGRVLTLANQLQAPLPRLCSIKRLDGFYNELSDELYRRDYGRHEVPDPPLKEVRGFLRALKTKEEIVEHGKQMRNCVGEIYLPKVLRGVSFLYEYTFLADGTTEIGTVELVKSGWWWHLGGVSSFAHGEVNEQALCLIRRWSTGDEELDIDTSS